MGLVGVPIDKIISCRHMALDSRCVLSDSELDGKGM